MKSAIPRGIIYRNLTEELKYLTKSLYSQLDDISEIDKFEKKFAKFNNSKYCISFPFARTAFYSILKFHKFKKGDEIILPPIQIKPMIEIVLNLKLKPVIVDLDKATLCYDLKDLKKKITYKTKGMLLTYLYGVVPDIRKIKDIVGKKILIIEDFSQCLNGKFKKKKVGNFGDYGIYSGSATKTLDTFGGGFIFLNNKKRYLQFKKIQISNREFNRMFLIKKILLSLFRNFLTNKYIFTFFTFYLINFLKFIYPNFTRSYLGKRDLFIKSNKLPKIWFSRFTSLQASFASKKLNVLNLEDKKRISNCNKIINNTNKSNFLKKFSYCENVYWQLLYICRNKTKLEKKFTQKKIDTATPSIILYSNLKNFKKRITTPIANFVYKNSLFVPSYHKLKSHEISRIIGVLKNE